MPKYRITWEIELTADTSKFCEIWNLITLH